jgi:hypothetical protein
MSSSVGGRRRGKGKFVVASDPSSSFGSSLLHHMNSGTKIHEEREATSAKLLYSNLVQQPK